MGWGTGYSRFWGRSGQNFAFHGNEKVPYRHIKGKVCPNDSNFISDRIFIKLEDNKDRNKILDRFDFGSIRLFT